jgi:hypothetical protein
MSEFHIEDVTEDVDDARLSTLWELRECWQRVAGLRDLLHTYAQVGDTHIEIARCLYQDVAERVAGIVAGDPMWVSEAAAVTAQVPDDANPAMLAIASALLTGWLSAAVRAYEDMVTRSSEELQEAQSAAPGHYL